MTRNLVRVTAGIDCDRGISIVAYYDPTEADQEGMSAVSAEVLAAVPQSFEKSVWLHNINDREPEMLDFWAFMRARQDA